MKDQQIQPEKITKPIQLTAVWFVALLMLVTCFLTAAGKISSPTWLAPMFAIAAIAIVPMFLVAVFLMQTRYRTHLQDDRHYSKWLNKQEQVFHRFKPENAAVPTAIGPPNAAPGSETRPGQEERRIARYQSVEGLFLIHSWRPSEDPAQVADIVIWLHQHRDGPLKQGLVEQVEYHLGPMFFARPVVKRNSHEKFKLEVSAYAPMLCLARVFIRGRSSPIDLDSPWQKSVTPAKLYLTRGV